jgi:hypothetical protein
MPKKNEIDVLRGYVAELDRFAALLRQSQEAIVECDRDTAVKKQAYDEAKEAGREARDVEHTTVTLLLRFVRPGSAEIFPLFDQMQPADEKKQGLGATEWRKEPIAVLGLSAAALRALIAADVVLVGQLQDLMLADREEWWGELDGVTPGMAEAIAAKFHAFIAERSP